MPFSDQATHFFERGWCHFSFDPAIARWVEAVEPIARESIAAPEHAQWLRSGGTWHAGVNVLPNDAHGRLASGDPINGRVIDFIDATLNLGTFAWDAAQVSVCYPGYPQRMEDETESVFNYRVRRCAAHVDGIERVGPDRRRFMSEHHAFVLGLPLTPTSPGASPLVVWEGSHRIVQQTLTEFFDKCPQASWYDRDITEIYHAMRRSIFDSCSPVVVTAQPGEAYITHRLMLHGIKPWVSTTAGGLSERMICYFRPPALSAYQWLHHS